MASANAKQILELAAQVSVDAGSLIDAQDSPGLADTISAKRSILVESAIKLRDFLAGMPSDDALRSNANDEVTRLRQLARLPVKPGF